MPFLHNNLGLGGLRHTRYYLKGLIMLDIGCVVLSLDVLPGTAVIATGAELAHTFYGAVMGYKVVLVLCVRVGRQG